MDLVLFVGLQASGKSSYFRFRFAATHTLVSKDLMRNNPNRERRQQKLVALALSQGDSVVVDNTNPAAADRAPLIEIARGFGARVICYYFESKLDACLGRNAAREGRLCIPEAGLRATARRLETPSFGEGFDEMYYVRIEGEGAFLVEPWREDPK